LEVPEKGKLAARECKDFRSQLSRVLGLFTKELGGCSGLLDQKWDAVRFCHFVRRCIVDIVAICIPEATTLVFRQDTDLSSRTTSPEGERRNKCSLKNDSTRSNQGPFSHKGPAQDEGSDSDQCPIPNNRTVHHGPMSHGNAISEDAGKSAMFNMKDRTVLEIGILTHFDPFLVSPQNAPKPN